MTLLPGQILDRYEVVKVLGQGGMAAVYEVRHTTLDSRHALKVLTVAMPGLRERLLQEGKLQAGLSHIHAVNVTDVIEVEGMPALVLELVDGPTLDLWVLQNPPRALRLRVLAQIAEAVATAHAQGLIHRDLKPANVLIATTPEGPRAKVTDFGIAKALSRANDTDAPHTRAGLPMGTPTYMAPEQLRDAAGVDARADVFALGVVMYEALTGEKCFEHGSLVELWERTSKRQYQPLLTLQPDLPPELHALIEACLSADPSGRPIHAGAVRDTLNLLLGLSPPPPPRTISHPPTMTLTATPAPVQRGPTESASPVVWLGLGSVIGVGMLTLILLVILGGLGIGASLNRAVEEAAEVVAAAAYPDDWCRPGDASEAPLGYAMVRGPLLVGVGKTWKVGRVTQVFTEIPSGKDAIPSCILPEGAHVTLRERTSSIKGQGTAVAVFPDALTLPEPPSDVPTP